MGNEESTPIITKFTPCTHRPLDSGNWEVSNRKRVRVSLHIHTNFNTISSATLSLPPIFQSQSFFCPVCRSSNFDGGLNKIIRCRCGLHLKRSTSGRVMQVPSSSFSSFSSNFEFQFSIPGIPYLPELKTLTLSVFQENLPEEFKSGQTCNFSSIFDQFLSPYFTQSLRCLGLGDYFQSSYARFKVQGCFPNYGLVTENTVIRCSDLISETVLSRVHILPIRPGIFNDSSFATTIQPFFRRVTRHVAGGESLFIEGTTFVVAACQPAEGLIGQETQFFFAGEPLEPLQYVLVSPFLEDLSFHYSALNQSALIEEVVNRYLMPFFQGFKRIICQGQTFHVEGVAFKVLECWPARGVSVDSTVFEYDGSFCQREGNGFYGPGTVLIRRGNVMEDPLLVLSQQMFQMQQIMVDGGREPEGVPESVIWSFPVEIVDENSNFDEDSKCTVCLCCYEKGESVKTLNCCKGYLDHAFHTPCIDQWLRRSTVCPLCKRSVLIS